MNHRTKANNKWVQMWLQDNQTDLTVVISQVLGSQLTINKNQDAGKNNFVHLITDERWRCGKQPKWEENYKSNKGNIQSTTYLYKIFITAKYF